MKKLVVLAIALMTVSSLSFAGESHDCTQSLDQELMSRSSSATVVKDASSTETVVEEETTEI